MRLSLPNIVHILYKLLIPVRMLLHNNQVIRNSMNLFLNFKFIVPCFCDNCFVPSADSVFAGEATTIVHIC